MNATPLIYDTLNHLEVSTAQMIEVTLLNRMWYRQSYIYICSIFQSFETASLLSLRSYSLRRCPFSHRTNQSTCTRPIALWWSVIGYLLCSKWFLQSLELDWTSTVLYCWAREGRVPILPTVLCAWQLVICCSALASSCFVSQGTEGTEVLSHKVLKKL